MARLRSPDAIIQRFLRTVHGLALTDRRVGIAFSGGADSLALAICASEAKRADVLDPVLIHVDHQARPTSGFDATRAADLATALDLPFHLITLAPTLNPTENSLREGRYAALATKLHDLAIADLMTAHHADDQAETVLLNLIRGTGADGASGMQSMRPLPADPSISLIRPFLSERRLDLTALVNDRNLAPVIDETNTDPAYRRNLIRHQVLPLLEETVPGAAAHLAAFARLMADDTIVLNAIAGDLLGELAHAEALSAAVLIEQPPAIASRMLRRWVHTRTGLTLSHDRSLALLSLARSGRGGASIEIGEGTTVSRVGRTLTMHATNRTSDGDKGAAQGKRGPAGFD